MQLREKSQALEGSVAGLDQQLKDLSDHCLALSWRLDLQEQTLGLKLSQVRRTDPYGRAIKDGASGGT